MPRENIMFVQRLTPVSMVDTDSAGLGMIVDACEALKTGPKKIDDLWPGQLLSLPTYANLAICFSASLSS